MDLEFDTLKRILIEQIGKAKTERLLKAIRNHLSDQACNAIIFANDPDGEFINVIPLSEN